MGLLNQGQYDDSSSFSIHENRKSITQTRIKDSKVFENLERYTTKIIPGFLANWRILLSEKNRKQISQFNVKTDILTLYTYRSNGKFSYFIL